MLKAVKHAVLARCLPRKQFEAAIEMGRDRGKRVDRRSFARPRALCVPSRVLAAWLALFPTVLYAIFPSGEEFHSAVANADWDRGRVWVNLLRPNLAPCFGTT